MFNRKFNIDNIIGVLKCNVNESILIKMSTISHFFLFATAVEQLLPIVLNVYIIFGTQVQWRNQSILPELKKNHSLE